MSDVDGYQWYRWEAAIRARRDLRCATKLVAGALAGHADNETGKCWPKHETLAAECALSESAVSKAVAELRRIGALEVDSGKGHRSSRFTLVPAGAWVPVGHPTVRPTKEEGRPDVQGSVAPAGEAGSPDSATQGRTTVRPELPTGPTEGATQQTPPAVPPHQQANVVVVVVESESSEEDVRTSLGTHSLGGDGACLPAGEVVDAEAAKENERAPASPSVPSVPLTGVWAKKLREYTGQDSDEALATPEEEAQLERVRELVEEAA